MTQQQNCLKTYNLQHLLIQGIDQLNDAFLGLLKANFT